MKSYGMLIDITKCIGCGLCVDACREANHLPESEDTQLTESSFTVLQTVGEASVRRLCMHCNTPSCASACPVGALYKTAAGPVAYDASKCMGCRYCMLACPFDVPKYEWSKAIPVVRKCVMCAERVTQGQPTACSEACTEGATIFGPRDELLAEAHKRITENPGKYVDHVYGEHEAGGTSVLFLADREFASLGFNPKILTTPYIEHTSWIMNRIPAFVGVWGTFLAGMWWLTKRKEEVAEHERRKRGEGGGDQEHDEDHD